MQRIYPDFIRNINASHSISDGDHLICGFSGGKDSLTLLLLLKETQSEISFDFTAAYFNHRIRPDADEEARWIETFCSAHDISLVTDEGDVVGFSQREGLNLEHAASFLRYRFFSDLANRLQERSSSKRIPKIVTAHTLSDQTETFFMKLFRGSGIQGLTSIAPKKGMHIIRPMLHLSSEEINDFLERNRIAVYQDQSNLDQRFLRNRVRHTLIPQIKTIVPDIDKKIHRTVRLIRDEYDYFRSESEKYIKSNYIRPDILNLKNFSGLHVALKRHVIRTYLREINGHLLNIAYDHIEDILSVISTGSGVSVPGLTLECNRNWLYPSDIALKKYRYELKAEQTELQIAETGALLTLARVETFRKPDNNRSVSIPESVLVYPLQIKTAEKGDRYTPINGKTAISVFELIRSAGYPAKLRNLCVEIVNGEGEIIWISGSPVNNRFKTTETTQGPFLEISLQFNGQYL